MSDREDNSPQRSGSRSPSHSSSPKASASAKSSPKASRSRSRSRERSFSRSRSRSYKRNSYRSRSRSRSRRHYSRSRSRSPYTHRRQRRSSRYSRSRSRSSSPYYNNRRHSPYYGGSGYSDRRRGYYRSHSRSPMSNRRRHVGSRDNPKTSRCIGIFGLSLYTQERDLRDVFGRFGPIEEVQVVYDHQTGRSRGFAFIYFRSHEDAHEAKEAAAGTEIDGRRIRVDYSITERAHTPTPGIYLGKPTTSGRDRGGRGGYGRRSPSPYASSSRRGSRYSRSRSRSRSYSPRRY